MISVDNTYYDVDMAQLRRQIKIDRKYELTTADAKKHGEISGVYYQYSLTLGRMTHETREAVIRALLASGDYRTITLPDGQCGTYTFSALVDTLQDELIADPEPYDTDREWGDLQVSLSSREPYTEGSI